jgi:uncharacterized membrane protein
MNKPIKFVARTRLDKAFEIGILVKALDGTIEIIAGLLLYFVSVDTINRIATYLTQEELSQDPHDYIANHILQAAHHVSHGSLIFSSVYLLVHGLVKVILVIEILRNRLWAYPGLIVITGAFMLYQIYQFGYSHSITLLLLTIFDGVVVWLTVLEYRKRRHHLAETMHE